MSGFAGNDTITGGLGADILAGGGGDDLFVDSAAGLSGDTITDFSLGDRIIVSDANIAGFSYTLNGHLLSFTGGSLTLENVPTGTLVASAAAGGGVQLSFSTETP